jgi:hypothetical protein
MKRPSYRAAIDWIVYNDTPESIDDTGHIASCLVSDLFDIPVEKVIEDAFKKKTKYDKRARPSCVVCGRPVYIIGNKACSGSCYLAYRER